MLVDTQFFLPNSGDFRAHADELGKPIDRVDITHEHPDAYQVNIDWLARAGELMTATTGEEFKMGLVEAFPDLGLEGAIDVAVPFLFPDDEAGS